MKSQAFNHPKTKRLGRLLGTSQYQTVGVLECLWQLAAECTRYGEVGKFSDEEIADFMGWQDGGKLVASLVESGWLDTCQKDRLVIHNWQKHCPDYVKKRLKRDSGGQRRTTADNGDHRRNDPTQPNPTNKCTWQNHFDTFWKTYPARGGRRRGKQAAREKFAKVPESEIPALLKATAIYAASKDATEGYAKDPQRFLTKEFWKDWLEPVEKPTRTYTAF